LKILFVSSEVFPFAKTGGLADVSGALPKTMKKLGHEVRIIMPKYKVVNERKFVLREVIRLKDIPILLGSDTKKISVKSAFTTDTEKIQTYFIDYKPYFGRDGLYVDTKSKKEYVDNDERFILFAKGIFETLKLLFWQPDIIHCNDWQTGLVPFFLRTLYKDDDFFKKTAALFTIHNVGYQGNFPAGSYVKTNIDSDLFTPGAHTEFYGKFSFMKTGIYYADFVNTVSPTYAKEVQETEEYGFGFEGIFSDRKKYFSGILNGVDYCVWDPETDALIPQNYSIRGLSAKVENKKALLEQYGLPFKENVPLIGVISRLSDQKGFDLIEEIKEALFDLDVQLVLLGTGEKKYHKMFQKLAKKYPEKVGVNLTFDNELAHRIEAGSDMFLMPSRYEPCGLNQMFSLKYGTVPVVRKTGGLADTIHEFDPETGKGNGFIFNDYDSRELLNAIKRALKIYKDQKSWTRIMKNGMKQDFSWMAAAKKYYKLYEKILKR
ncbi:glycogen synthase GlgA, partial [candidate division KSB1 bacterium]